MRSLTLFVACLFLSLAACSAQASVAIPTGAPLPASSPTSALAPTVEPTLVSTIAPAAESPTPAATVEAATPYATGTRASGAQDCGQVTMLGPNPPRDATALQSEQCFWQAFQQCRAVALTVVVRGVDAGTTHRFTLNKTGSACGITDAVSSYVVPLRTPSAQSITCANLTQKEGGLLFMACGDRGDIFVPAPGTP